MKKHLRFLSLILVLVTISLPLVSCMRFEEFSDFETVIETNVDTESDTVEDAGAVTNAPETEETEEIYVGFLQNISEYVVVRPDLASKRLKDSVSALVKKIEKETDAELEIKTEFDARSTYEILIGDLERNEIEEVKAELSNNDYAVKLKGNKVVIAGGCEEALLKAIDYFANNLVVEGKVLVPTGNSMVYKHDYVFDSIKINGTPIEEYKIYSSNTECSSRLIDNISAKLIGKAVKTTKSMADNDGLYIVLDPTSMNYTHYKAELRDGNLYVSGSYKSCYEFFDYFVKQGVKEVNITESFEGDLDKPELYTKEELMYVLKKAYREPGRVIIGQESIGDIKTPYEGSINLFREATEGTDPGIVGIDLGWAGMCLYAPARSQEKANDRLKSQVFCEMVEYAEMGGIFTVGSHFINPNESGRAHLTAGNEAMGFLGREDAFEALITPGTALNNNFRAELDACIEWLKYLQEIGLPVVYRPLHEMTHGTFWWSLVQKWANGRKYYIEAEAFINLWKYVYSVFAEAGLDNLIWFYCPDWFEVDCMKGYPGDEYCDIVGVDWYTSGKLEIARSGGVLAKLSKTNKPIAIGEMGQNHVYGSSMDYVDALRDVFRRGFSLSYTMTWTGHHRFGYLGDGKEAIDSGVFICREELSRWFAEARRELGEN